MVLSDVTNNSLVVAVLVRWISPLDSYIYAGTWSIITMDCPPDGERT